MRIGVQSKGKGLGLGFLLLRREDVLLDAHGFASRAGATFLR
ncbi:hypothetical protein PSN13_00928 [Micromonospora saelicesensis]|uniref:Uncharacterized protein n=1 Tax=Micromonospora saelicesensis TaxID=285676 RepID=A0A328NRN9_9ACTN|nr:hypothetical protein PSN13_00928 [Micromonospora saelicesensis]